MYKVEWMMTFGGMIIAFCLLVGVVKCAALLLLLLADFVEGVK